MGLISNGTTIFDNGAMASGFGGNMVLVSSATASSSANIEFSLGSYKEYQFWFIDINPATDGAALTFNMSTDSGSNYNVTKTTTSFNSIHTESGATANISYKTNQDLAQSTAFQIILVEIGNGADESGAGTLNLFNPSSTTYVKHFTATTNMYNAGNITVNSFTAGYGNTTTAINAVRFQMSSGNFDGTILMYGIV